MIRAQQNMVKIQTLRTDFIESKGSFWIIPFSLGLSLILFGILIIIMPELLAVLVAAGIIFAGISLLLFALKIRRSKQSVVRNMFDPLDV